MEQLLTLVVFFGVLAVGAWLAEAAWPRAMRALIRQQLALAFSKARQVVCGMHGHDALLHFEKARMSLLCSSCGYETPGWDLRASTTRTTPAPVARPRVIRMPLIGPRRIA